MSTHSFGSKLTGGTQRADGVSNLRAWVERSETHPDHKMFRKLDQNGALSATIKGANRYANRYALKSFPPTPLRGN